MAAAFRPRCLLGRPNPRRCVGRRLLPSGARVATGQARFDGGRAREASGRQGQREAVWLSPAGGRRADRWRREAAAAEEKTRLGADGGDEVLHRPRLRSLCLLLDGRLRLASSSVSSSASASSLAASSLKSFSVVGRSRWVEQAANSRTSEVTN